MRRPWASGRLGATGIEVAGFDRDFRLVHENQSAFPHYYFYEMGRNWYAFGDRHSSLIRRSWRSCLPTDRPRGDRLGHCPQGCRRRND